MKTIKIYLKAGIIVCALSLLTVTNGSAQEATASFGGPRLGVTHLSGKLEDMMYKHNMIPVITQFGWQFEERFFSTENGPTGIVECVPLIGGIEQGKIFPSLSALIGLRTSKGFEFGVGPNLSYTSVAAAGIVLAAGVNIQKGKLNFPINFALTPSKYGVKFSILIGFNAAVEE